MQEELLLIFASVCAKIQVVGTYWYVKDPNSEEGFYPVFEDDYVAAIFRIAQNNGIKITDKMILKEVQNQGKE